MNSTRSSFHQREVRLGDDSGDDFDPNLVLSEGRAKSSSSDTCLWPSEDRLLELLERCAVRMQIIVEQTSIIPFLFILLAAVMSSLQSLQLLVEMALLTAIDAEATSIDPTCPLKADTWSNRSKLGYQNTLHRHTADP